MSCSTAIRAVVFATAMGLCAPAFAQTDGAKRAGTPVAVSEMVVSEGETPQPETDAPLTISGRTMPAGIVTSAAEPSAHVQRADEIEAPLKVGFENAPEAAMSIEHIDITVENKPLSVRSRRTGTDGVLIEASPIFTHLLGKVTVEGTVLSNLRFQDGAVMSLDVSNGTVRANGTELGALPDFEPLEQASTWITPNTIGILTGTVPEQNEVGDWTFTLDDRLRPRFDLDLWVNGERTVTPEVEPRSIGPVLLIPLAVVTEALGHALEVEGGNMVTVTRIQDAARITLDLSTGLVTVNGTPRGVTPNIAYADPDLLLLPFTAVETLTGTHILLEPGTSDIVVTLDDRLGGGVLPGERVVDEAGATGFIPEQLQFALSDRGPVSLQFDSRLRGLNTQLRYETVGGPTNAAELAPGWVSLEVQALNGWVGSVGDSNSRFRELSGVDENRVRGVTWRKQRKESGDLIAITAGVPLSGSEQVSDTASRPTFSGFAAGARWLAAEGDQEFGISAATSPNGAGQRVVIGGQKQIDRSGFNDSGVQSLFVAADAGVFNDATGTRVDFRGRAQGGYRFNTQAGLQASLSYDGGSFSQGGGLSDASSLEGALSGPAASRFVGAVSADWRAVKDWGPISRVATGVRTSYSRTSGTNTTPSSSTLTVAGAFNGRVTPLDLNVSVDTAFSKTNTAAGNSDTRTIGVRAFRRFNWGTVQAVYSNTDTDGETVQRFVSSVSVLPIRKELGDGASVAAGPTASVVWSPEQTFGRVGATVSANSGQKFGDRFNVQGQFSALQSVDPEDSRTQLFASLNASYAITRFISLESSYFDNLAGSRDFSVALRGRLTFNEPRKHTRPEEGLGILRGSVYFDRNRDGVRQPDEEGVPGVRVQVTGTRLALGVDRDGLFTIQNIKSGLYGVTVDRRTLPLGLLVPDDASARATIGEGRVTELEIPIVASGQIRGTLFVDDNEDGETTPGEHRVEGMYLTLKRVDEDADEEDDTFSALSASFGQFSFENLAPGRYELSVNFKGIVYSRSVELAEDNLFVVQPFGLIDEGSGVGAGTFDDPISGGVLGEA